MQTTTKGLAVEYAKYGIRVNAISPALGETAMLGLVIGKEDTPENRAPLLASIPMGRFARVTDVANVACFLASEEASYMTGSCVEVDGGRVSSRLRLVLFMLMKSCSVFEKYCRIRRTFAGSR